MSLTANTLALGGRFRLIRVLGEGGMGVVWEAQDVRTGRHHAIKFLREEARRADTERRFLREAQAANAVSHPSILRIDEVADHDGAPAFVMELLEGESLGARLEREKRLSVGQTAAIVRHAVSALRAAHAAGVVHRDLKPDNIFVTREGDGRVGVRVLDFGIARLDRAQEKLTVTGALMGTPLYMSPEQAAGEKGLDARTDVWSLTTILFECLTGSTPIVGDNYGQILSRLIQRNFRRLGELPEAASLPPDLVAIIDAALVDAEDRSSDLGPLEALLERHSDAAIEAPPGSPATSRSLSPVQATVDAATLHDPTAGGAAGVRGGRRSSRGPLLAVLAGLAVLGVVAGAVAVRTRATRASTAGAATSASAVASSTVTSLGTTSDAGPATDAPGEPSSAAAAAPPAASEAPPATSSSVASHAGSSKKKHPPSAPSASAREPGPGPARLQGGVAGHVPF